MRDEGGAVFPTKKPGREGDIDGESIHVDIRRIDRVGIASRREMLLEGRPRFRRGSGRGEALTQILLAVSTG